MTIHYHGTPITPLEVLYSLAGKHFCVSYANPEQVRQVHELGQSVMLDNGAFSFWTRNEPTDWEGYYRWVEPWLACQTTWAVIPDIIDGSEGENDKLLVDWPFPDRGAPVWHLHESLERLDRLRRSYKKICIGSSGQYATVGDACWHARMVEAFNNIDLSSTWVHMLRGMSLAGSIYPFASLDSTDVGRNHNRKDNAKSMADRWDAIQCPAVWQRRPEQLVLT